MIDHVSRLNVVKTVVVVAIIVLVGMQAMSVATSPEMQQYAQKSAEWCEERDGDLYNSRVFGPHGGLHCELPNGEVVHMSDIVSVGGSD